MITRKMRIVAARGIIDVLKIISLKNLDITDFKYYYSTYSACFDDLHNPRVRVHDVYNVYLANVKHNNLNISNELLTFDEFARAMYYLLYNSCTACLACIKRDDNTFSFNKLACLCRFGATKEYDNTF